MSQTNEPRILLVVPAYNESANIEKVVATLRSHGLDFIVINDGSTDETEDVLVRIGAPHVRLVNNLGIGGAVQTGYRYALAHGYDIAVQFDGDGQHDASYVAPLVRPLVEGRANLAIGSRFVGDASEFKSSGARRAGIKLLSGALRVATGQTVRDITSGFRAADRRAITLFSEHYPTDYPEPESISFALARGLSVTEVPVAMHAREGGSSSIAGLDVVWYMLKVGLSILLRGTYRGRGKRE